MKITRQRLKQLIKEELAHAANDDVIVLEENPEFESTYRPPVAQVIDLMESLYDSAMPDRKEWFEKELIKRFTELVHRWRTGREESSNTEDEYPEV